MIPRSFAGNLGGTTQRTSNLCNEIIGFLFLARCFHGPFSISNGSSPELSYTAQVSASRQ